MACSIPLDLHHSIGMLIYICEYVQVHIACAFRGGNSLCKSLSTRRDSPLMGKYFRCRVYTSGQLSFGAERSKKADLWLV